MFIATVKPTPDARDRVRALLGLGFTEFRVNFARGAIDSNVCLMAMLRELAREFGRQCTVFVDLPGPKVRLDLLEHGDEWLTEGQRFRLDGDGQLRGNRERASVADSSFLDRCTVGDILDLAGGVLLEVQKKAPQRLDCRVIKGGKIYNRCGLSARGKYWVNLRLTDEDKRVLESSSGSADYICPSFVDSAELVHEVRSLLLSGVRPGVIAKIESPVGTRRLDAIAAAADGLMLCRGDLGMFLSQSEIRALSRRMKRITVNQGKLLVFATGYFASMESGGWLSRHDELNIAQALSMGVDYLVLNETSSSGYWLEIARRAMTIGAEHWPRKRQGRTRPRG